MKLRKRVHQSQRQGFGLTRDWPSKQSLTFGGVKRMQYRCEATSVAGFIQQLAVGYVARGYVFYVVGRVPEEKDPRRLDEKLIHRYGILASKGARARRKAL